MKPIPNTIILEEVEQMISIGNSVELKVKGQSMRPYLRSGKDKIILSPFRPVDLKCGAIVLFRYDHRYVFHRIIKIENENLIIQGDGNKSCEKALKSDVIGVVRGIVRPGGKTISLPDFSSEVYWRCWRFLRPIRRYLLAVYDLLYAFPLILVAGVC